MCHSASRRARGRTVVAWDAFFVRPGWARHGRLSGLRLFLVARGVQDVAQRLSWVQANLAVECPETAQGAIKPVVSCPVQLSSQHLKFSHDGRSGQLFDLTGQVFCSGAGSKLLLDDADSAVCSSALFSKLLGGYAALCSCQAVLYHGITVHEFRSQ